MPNNNNNTWISRRQQSVGDFFRTLRNFAVSAMPENIKTFLRIEQESDSKNLINNLENDLRKENVRRDKIETEAMKDIEIYIQQKDRKIRKADNLEDIVYLAKKTASRTGRDFDICIELESTGIDYDHDWNPIARNEEPRILRIVAHKNGRVEFFKAIRGYESMPVENMPAELKYKDLKQAMYT